MATAEKDTIYIDIDDEITAIIDKVQASHSKIVALVLPKRATVLQSVVNMKLLKRAADGADKNLVLITSEAGLLPLAGAAGVHIAKNLQSKPEVPASPTDAPIPEEEPEVDAATEEPEAVDPSQSVGELATKSTTSPPEETIEVDNDAPVEEAAGAAGAKAKKSKSKKDKNKIPNFDQFRKRLFIIGGAVIALIVLSIFMFFILPKATITIKTDTSSKDAQVSFIASAAAQSVDENSATVPSKVAESPKSESQKAPATGTKDAGTKASGTITVKNCEDTASRTLGAGTAFTANGKTFYSNAGAVVPAGQFSGGGTKCNSSSVGIPVTAAENGDSYNIAATSYSSGSLSGNFVITGSAMGGGSSKTVQVVTQADVDAAKAKLTNGDDAAKQQLKKTLEDQGYYAIVDTFTVKDASVTASPDVGQEGSEVTVTSKGTYQMVGVKEDDLKKVIDKGMSSEIDSSKEQVQDYGLKDATFKVTKASDNGNVAITVNTQLAVGPKIDEAQLKQQVAGKKRGDTENDIKSLPGVKDVDVHYSPFWVSKTPKKTSKITIVLQKAN